MTFLFRWYRMFSNSETKEVVQWNIIKEPCKAQCFRSLEPIYISSMPEDFVGSKEVRASSTSSSDMWMSPR